MERPAPLELALYALCWAAPLAIGAVHPTTQVLLAGVALALIAWLVLGVQRERALRLPPLVWLGVAAMAWTALSILPLPFSLVRVLSPAAADLRGEVGARWIPLSLDVPATVLALVRQLAGVSVLLVGAELFRKRSTLRPVQSLALLGGLVAVLVGIHRVFGLGSIYGLYTPRALPGAGFFAPFVSGNHAASLLSLSALCAAGVAVASSQHGRALFGTIAGAAGLATLATMSRGGALGLAIGALLLVGHLAISHFGRLRGVLLSLAIVGTLGGGALLIADGLRTRFTTYANHDSFAENQKTRGWIAGLRMGQAYPLTGVGRGAFEAPVERFREGAEGVRLVYPENLVVQRLAEWGYPFTIGFVVAAVGLFIALLRRLRLDPPAAGLAAGIVAVTMHELVDFGLEFPGVLLPLSLAAAALVGPAEADRSGRRRPRARLRGTALVAAGLASGVLVIAGWFASTRTLADDVAGARAALDAAQPEAKDVVRAAIARHPASAELEVLAGEEALRRHDPSALHHLGRAMRLQPSATRPHHLAAIELVRLRRYTQAALELRLAVERGANLNEVERIRLVGRYAVDAVPREPQALLRMGAQLAAMKRWEDAERAYQRAAELDPGPGPRAAWLAWLPPERRAPAAEAMARDATTAAELATAIGAFAGAGQTARAEGVLAEARRRFPDEAAVVVAGARLRAVQGDLPGARALVGSPGHFDRAGRILVEELRLELAEKAGDREGVLASRARLRLLRARADLEEPSGQ